MKFIKTLLFVVIATLFTSAIKAQSIGDYIDVVFLKNGSIIKGIIIEINIIGSIVNFINIKSR
jgi:hypothetical protein